jgi:hypothetical protein
MQDGLKSSHGFPLAKPALASFFWNGAQKEASRVPRSFLGTWFAN